MSAAHPAREAIAAKGWLRAHKWLLLRRSCQLAVLALFLCGPLTGVWLMKGNLSSSLILDIVPLTDPLAFLQTVCARHWPELTAIIGAGILLAFYLLVGGRVFCAWVCPMNIVTDGAHWLRRRLGLKGGRTPHAKTRYWLLGGVLAAASVTGMQVWEWVNPVSILHRGLIFGGGLGWLVIAGVFIYDLILAPRGWCGHVCPLGATYALLGRWGMVQVSAVRRKACDDCMDCMVVCPEPVIIRPALKGIGQDHPAILDSKCTRCARCIDVCAKDVFELGTRFNRSEK
ncbi:MAG: quinol dehydrogenase ferredoxin subunit NapH [Rhodocyclaceae bacterium]